MDIDQLACTILAEHARGRRLLVVVGAGVSRPAGAPLMKDIYLWLERELSRETGRRAECALALARELSSGSGSRSQAARLFGELQDSSDDAFREIWGRFTVAFRDGALGPPPVTPRPMSRLIPTAAHNHIARWCAELHAVPISFNFDGLLRKARTNGPPPRPCLVLDSARSILDFFSSPARNSEDSCSYVIKMRGDIFFATCRSRECPLLGVAQPVYEWPSANPGEPLLCAQCGRRRLLGISFPGYGVKEEESRQVISAVITTVLPATSSCLLLGFSGVWDNAFLEGLYGAASQFGFRVVDVKPDATSGYVGRAPRAMCSARAVSPRCTTSLAWRAWPPA